MTNIQQVGINRFCYEGISRALSKALFIGAQFTELIGKLVLRTYDSAITYSVKLQFVELICP